ncbi:unnamed protein product [Hermetia illucens]|uniref:Uncharacterized protein n=1 Tax=Hermetia illucens TaxID=343691 RepID=A0A7R8YVV0_HERIL|nr:general odorant-binding protein 99b-like [Hermetia illucens]CAD7087212.1 unnamed protein product [Hermetia illucens]
MKLLIGLCAMIAMVASQWSPSTKIDYLKFREECFKSENVPQSAIDKLNNEQYGEDLGHEAKCYIRCLGVKTGTWDDTKGYDIEKGYQNLISWGFEVNKENLQKCATPNTENDDKCVWAAKNTKCLWTNKYVTKKQ